jgi:hypothetical protein
MIEAQKVVDEMLDGLASHIHDQVLEDTGDLGAADSALWQRVRDGLLTNSLIVNVQLIYEREVERAEANR